MPLASNIRVRRSQLNLSQKDLALKAGVSQQLIAALENGAVRSTKFLHEIAVALGTTIGELEPKFGMTAPAPDMAATDPGRHEDLPVFSAEDNDDGTIAVSLEPVDYISRPSPLEFVRGSYGLIIVNELMAPEFEIGDIVLVNPHLPPIPNSSCVFYAADREKPRSHILRLLRSSRSEWCVTSWSFTPDARSERILPRDLWNKCHRIVGRYNRR